MQSTIIRLFLHTAARHSEKALILMVTSALLTLSSTARAQDVAKNPADIRAHMLREAHRSKPDYVVYVPQHWDSSKH
ncbi:MAG: hypothetical protein GX616_11125, partial [Planctomycetes bacterium]|nr:hypothetical protein [Planctomycetota bacterium]